MAIIIITIIIAIATFVVLTNKGANEEIIHTIVKFIVVAGVFIGLFAPLSGYEDKARIKEIIPIQYENGKFYKTVSSKIYYQYEYRPKVTRDDSEIMIVEDIIRTQRAKVIKTDEAEAKIVLYRRKAKSSIWTFGLTYKEEYEVYDPI